MSGTTTPDPAVDLTNLANTRAWLSALSLPAIPDAQLQQMLSAMSAAIQSWLGYNLLQATYTTSFDGKGAHKVGFPNGPVTAVTAVSVDNVVIPAATDQISRGYLFGVEGLCQSWLYLRGYRFWRGVQNCSVSYTAGFTASNIPPAILEACSEAIAALSQVAGREPGLIEEKVGGLEERYAAPTATGSTNLNTFVLTPAITFALAPLRRVVPAW